MKFEYYETPYGYSILKKEDLEALHAATLNLMEDYGVCVFGRGAHEVFSSCGCEVDEETSRVKFPRNIVNDCIESAPESYTLYGRDGEPEKEVQMSPGVVTYTTFGTGVAILDPVTGERRDTTLQDVRDIARFADAVDEVETVTIPVAAQDVSEEIKDLYEGEALLLNTSKHIGHDTEGGKNTRTFLKMAAAVAGGADKLREKPIVSLGACPNSPLEIHESAAEQIIEAAKAGVPMDILSMGLCGGTTPVTLAGTLLTTNCEVLAGIILSQLVSKGAPVYYSTSTTIMDLKHATSPVGAPEHAMIGAAVAQIGKYYGIPTVVGGT